jgi:hypothetical protein
MFSHVSLGDQPQYWVTLHNNLGDTLKELGMRTGGEEGRKLLEEAVAADRSALEIQTKADLPQDWAATQNDLGDTLKELGIRTGGIEENCSKTRLPPIAPLSKSGARPICLKIGHRPRAILAKRLKNSGCATAQKSAANCSKMRWPLFALQARLQPWTAEGEKDLRTAAATMGRCVGAHLRRFLRSYPGRT